MPCGAHHSNHLCYFYQLDVPLRPLLLYLDNYPGGNVSTSHMLADTFLRERFSSFIREMIRMEIRLQHKCASVIAQEKKIHLSYVRTSFAMEYFIKNITFNIQTAKAKSILNRALLFKFFKYCFASDILKWSLSKNFWNHLFQTHFFVSSSLWNKI